LIRGLFDLRKGGLSKERLDRQLLALISKEGARPKSFHPLIAYAASLWEQGIDPHLFTVIMTQQLESMNRKSEQAVVSLKNLAKYPPSLGMTGTVIGMVSLFSNLTPENRNSIGPNLAFAMTATFFGLVLSNWIIMPIADRLHLKHLEQVWNNEYVFRVLMLIHKGYPLPAIKEGMNEIAA
jgi:chemotaxis protein MotA